MSDAISLRHKVLLQTGAATTGPWIRIDNRYQDGIDRAIQVSLQEGDTIRIEGITQDAKGMDKSFLTTLGPNDISVLKEYTESAGDVLQGSWTYIRAVKVGTAGFAKVQGFV